MPAKKSPKNDEPVKVAKVEEPKKPKKDSKAALIKKLEAKGLTAPEGTSASDMEKMLEWRSNLFWLVRLSRSTSPFLMSCGIDNKKTVYALPDNEDSERILRTRRLVILKRTPILSNNAVIIMSIGGDGNGSDE
jgi:hypothetical protein